MKQTLVVLLKVYIIKRVKDKMYYIIYLMDNYIILFISAYIFLVFYRDAIKETKFFSNKLKICNLELQNYKLYLKLHNITFDENILSSSPDL